MKNKTIIFIGILLLFSACSEKIYRSMYDNKYNVFDNHAHTSAEENIKTMQNGENPLKRPSYNEYRQK